MRRLRMIFKNSTRFGLLVALASGALTGCAGSPPPEPPPGVTEEPPPPPPRDVIHLRDLEGGLHTLFDGTQPTLAMFWSTKCAQSRRTLPKIAEAAGTWGREFQFFGVLSGDRSRVDEVAAQTLATRAGLRFPQLLDRERRLAGDLQIEETPAIVLFARDGSILYRGDRLPSSWAPYLEPDSD